MRICVLHSSYQDADHMLEDFDSHLPDPFPYTQHHTFDHHMVSKSTAREDIDAAVAKSYDFYFNFMWGQLEDSVAGIRAIEYFESLGLPHIGQPSRILHRSKADFYAAAQRIGHPRVPGTANYPFFVKPAIGCFSMFVDRNSVCHNETELKAAVDRLEGHLRSRREIRDQDLANESAKGHAVATNGEHAIGGNVKGIKNSADVVVQEYIDGQDYSCIVIEHYTTPVALTPTVYRYPKSTPSDKRFLTFGMKADEGLKVELVSSAEAQLIQALQKTAIEAFHTAQMSGATWCNVDMRVPVSGDPVVMEVNPMPAIFLPPGHQWEDPVIAECIPGGHRALIDIIIATYHLQQKTYEKVEVIKAEVYDKFAPGYESIRGNLNNSYRLMALAIAKWDYRGVILDTAAGTAAFVRILRTVMGSQPGDRATAIELSPAMRRMCEETGLYEEVIAGTLQTVVPSMTDFDHFIMIGVAHFLSTEELSLALSCAFRTARKSITLSIDEIPDRYNQHLQEMGEPHSFMVGRNHITTIEEFGVPKGWRLADKFRDLGWRSPKTNDDVQVTMFRYERL